MEKVAIYEANVKKDGKIVSTDIWETDISPEKIAKYYKNQDVEIKETKYKQRIKTKEEIEEE